MLTNWRQGKADNSFPLVCGTIGEWFYMTQIVGIRVVWKELKMTQGNIRTGKIKTLTSQIWKPFGAVIGAYKGKSKGKWTKWTAPWSSVHIVDKVPK